MSYPYTRENILRKTNKYAYTPYQGQVFLDNWLENRRSIIKKSQYFSTEQQALSAEKILSSEIFELISSNHTGQKFADLYRSLQQINREIDKTTVEQVRGQIFRYVKRFEITRRIHEEYDNDLKPIDRSQYRCLELYVAFSIVMIDAFQKLGDLQFVNVLFKCNDIIVSKQAEIPGAAFDIGCLALHKEIEIAKQLLSDKDL